MSENVTTVSLVLLTYNEAEGVAALLERILAQQYEEVFAVDGGSTDGTLDLFSGAGVEVLSQRSKGRGEAFRLAVERARCEALVFFSPDGNEEVDDISRFRAYLNQGYDLVIASRMMPGAWNEEDEHWFRPRKWANKTFNLAANLFWNRGPFVTDSINGFRAIRKSVFQRLALDATGYDIEYQMSIRAMKAGLRIAESPTREGSRIGGESYARSLPTGLLFVRRVLKEIRVGRGFLREP